ncbi:MAG: hypothetical protein ACI9HY_002388 [Planctomycetaceae bacterium]
MPIRKLAEHPYDGYGHIGVEYKKFMWKYMTIEFWEDQNGDVVRVIGQDIPAIENDPEYLKRPGAASRIEKRKRSKEIIAKAIEKSNENKARSNKR